MVLTVGNRTVYAVVFNKSKTVKMAKRAKRSIKEKIIKAIKTMTGQTSIEGPTSMTGSNASDRVLAVVELLENILLHLPLKDLIVRAPLVCTQWQSVCKGSIRIRCALHLEPLNDNDTPICVDPFYYAIADRGCILIAPPHKQMFTGLPRPVLRPDYFRYIAGLERLRAEGAPTMNAFVHRLVHRGILLVFTDAGQGVMVEAKIYNRDATGWEILIGVHGTGRITAAGEVCPQNKWTRRLQSGSPY